jgi:hypothetical protein
VPPWSPMIFARAGRRGEERGAFGVRGGERGNINVRRWGVWGGSGAGRWKRREASEQGSELEARAR